MIVAQKEEKRLLNGLFLGTEEGGKRTRKKRREEEEGYQQKGRDEYTKRG